MMRFSYFPGCTLKTRAKHLDACARAAAEALGVTLAELPDWQCCGAVYPMAKDEIATRLSSVRALAAAREAGEPLVTLCSACHNVIKQVNRDMARDAGIALRVNNYLGLDTPYHGETEVLHLLEVLRDRVGFDEVKKKVIHPLTGRKIGAFYGCLLLRPGRVMAMDDPENPSILEDLLAALGAEPVRYGRRNECCGGYVTLDRRETAERLSAAVLDNAAAAGAETLVTACPLCLYNLCENGGAGKVPVVYFTELLAEALGCGEVTP